MKILDAGRGSFLLGGSRRIIMLALLCCGLNGRPLAAATMELRSDTVTRMAIIDQNAPRLSWAGAGIQGGSYSTTELLLLPGRAFLLAFDIDQIPEGQRIVQAELRINLAGSGGHMPRLCVWRMVAEWGIGVSWEARQQRPQRADWAVMGGLGPGLDRSVVPSFVVTEQPFSGELALDVTQDVTLWYAGVSPNHGWMFTVDDPGVWVKLLPPFWNQSINWRAPLPWTLQITFEPEVKE